MTAQDQKPMDYRHFLIRQREQERIRQQFEGLFRSLTLITRRTKQTMCPSRRATLPMHARRRYGRTTRTLAATIRPKG